MRVAEDFRSIARDALSGKWKTAVITGLIAMLLGGVSGNGPDVKVNIDASSANASFDIAGHTIFSTGGSADSAIYGLLIGGFTYIMIIALILVVLYFILGSVVSVGYARFNLNLVDGFDATTENLFAYFSHWKTTAAADFLQMIYILLWSLLFVIPGIMASYSYAMTKYILAENPEMSASEAIDLSKEMMDGNRWRLFCLDFSFIGWELLCALTLGIGNLWLVPYRQAAMTAFYREVSGTEYRIEEQDWSGDASF